MEPVGILLVDIDPKLRTNMKKTLFFSLLAMGILASPVYGQSSITITGSATMLVTNPDVSHTVFVTAGSFIDSNSGLQFTVSGGTENKSDAYSETPVPVELVSFTVEVGEDSVKLYWETATEVNNYGFEVERASIPLSSQTVVWEILGFIEGHGNSNSPKYYEFIDQNRLIDSVEYRLKQIDTDGVFQYYGQTVKVEGYSTTAVSEEVVPKEFKLFQNYPNPFNPSTEIVYSIPEASKVSLKVYNVLGEEIASLVDANKEAGKFNVIFNSSNLPSGIYFYSIKTNNNVSVKKMILLK